MTDDDCDLTPRELYAASVVGEHYAVKLRTVVMAVAVALLVGTSGNFVGWVLTRNESVQRDSAIQQSRLELLIDNCEAASTRNRNTKAALDQLAPKHPTARERRGIGSTKLLIDALAPYTADCPATQRDRLQASEVR